MVLEYCTRGMIRARDGLFRRINTAEYLEISRSPDEMMANGEFGKKQVRLTKWPERRLKVSTARWENRHPSMLLIMTSLTRVMEDGMTFPLPNARAWAGTSSTLSSSLAS